MSSSTSRTVSPLAEHLPLAFDLIAQHRWDPDGGHRGSSLYLAQYTRSRRCTSRIPPGLRRIGALRPRTSPSGRRPPSRRASSRSCGRCRRSSSRARRETWRRRSARSPGAGVPAPGGRVRRVVSRLQRRLDPREAEDLPADVGGDDLRIRAAAREGRPDRGPVREAEVGADGARGRPRAAVVLRAHGQRRRTDTRGANARSGPAAAGLPPVGRHAQPRPRLHERRLRRPHAGAHVEPGVRRRARPRVSATRRSPPRSSARSTSSARAGSTWRRRSGCTASISGRATRVSCSTTRKR